MACGKLKELSFNAIIRAKSGDEKALNAVIHHYGRYIRSLATRVLKDEYGNEYFYVDEDMRIRLETKLIYSIVRDFKILPS